MSRRRFPIDHGTIPSRRILSSVLAPETFPSPPSNQGGDGRQYLSPRFVVEGASHSKMLDATAERTGSRIFYANPAL